MRKTKIVGTIGPASMSYSTLKALVQAGLDIVRINLSHAELDGMNQILDNVRRVREELRVPLPIMIDTKGPEIRVGTFKGGSVNIKRGQTFIFTGRKVQGDSTQVSLSVPEIVKNLKVGGKILAVNGLLSFKIVEIKGKDVITKAQNSGTISSRKSLSIPNVKYTAPYLNAADKEDILWAINNDVELIAASFVNTKEDVMVLRDFIEKNHGRLKIISKIESALGVKNLDEIIDCSDGLMVARGDLGVEVAMEKLPSIQKQMIKKALEKGKPVITATEMLESMIYSNRPTRAEVSDVANAVYDGTTAVMLSGETASGKFPVLAVKMMAKVTAETERHIDYYKNFDDTAYNLQGTEDVVSHSAVNASFVKKPSAMVVFTKTGKSACMISRFAPSCPVVGATPDEIVYRQLALLWGVKPVLTPVYESTDEMFALANDIVKKYGFAKKDDHIIITCGTSRLNGETNLIKVDKVK